MDIQKVASTGTAVAVLGTGAFVGGNHQIYIQLVNNWPTSSGPVKGLTVPKQDYRREVPK